MKKFLCILAIFTIVLNGQDNWVQEQVLFEEVDGKSYIVRINEAIKAGNNAIVIELCDEISQKSTKPANKARAIVIKGDALVAQGEDEEALLGEELSEER